MRLQEVQQLFPSVDGNAYQQNQFLGLINQLVTSFDKQKDPTRSVLGELRERGADFYQNLIDTSAVPSTGQGLERVVDELIEMSQGHPYQTRNYLTNMIPQANTAGILGMLTANLLNSNPIWDVYGPAAAEAEVKVVAMMSKIAGYDETRSSGYTTWGGQGAVFSSLRLAIAKQFPDAKEEGVPNNLYCFASEIAHYSLLKSMEATGLGSKRLISVKTNPDHSMNTRDLSRKMEEVVARGGIPLFVVATTGTTDSFGIDDIQEIKRVADRVTKKHDLAPVYIHADSAAGGFYSFFNDYDFEANPLEFEIHVVKALQKIVSRLQHLHLADTMCYDFHKLGQNPYVSSLFLVKDRQDLALVDLDSSDTPYIGYREYGSYHTSYTLECSRSASAMAMYASLLAFGKEGYQRLLANYVRVNLAFRRQLVKAIPNIAVINEQNPGPVTAFRIYPDRVEWLKEVNGTATAMQIAETNTLNDRLFTRLGKHREEILFGDTKKLCLVDASDSSERLPIYASKFFSISAYTEVEHVEQFVAFLKGHIEALMLENRPKIRHFGS
jgi:glutamate/tyrosine decarboxylase-like PLP-dependent enzyme